MDDQILSGKDYINAVEACRNNPNCLGIVWPKKRNAGRNLAQLELLAHDLKKGSTVYYYGADPVTELPKVMDSLKEHFGVDATYELAPKTRNPMLKKVNDLPEKDIYIIKKK